MRHARLFATIVSLLLSGCAAEPASGPEPAPASFDAARSLVPIDADDPTLGDVSAPITIVLFVDFECRYSADAYRQARAVAGANRDVRLVVKQHPLGGHLFAPLASRAALAAHLQGRFDEMAVHLFGAPDRDRASILAGARTLGLDLARFERDLDSLAIERRVEADGQLARSLGASGTPSWFVNGVFFKGKLDDERLSRVIELERGYVADLITGGLAAEAVYDHLMAAAGTAPVLPLPAPVELDVEDRYAIPVGDGDLHFGPADAPVTAVLFADLECPHTRRQWRALERVRRDAGVRLRVVVVHDPLPQHRFALTAHLAVAAAQELGRGEELVAALLGGGAPTDHEGIFAVAARLGLDPNQLELAGGAAAGRVEAGRRLAARFGVRGTPTTFVNGRPIVGVASPDMLRLMIDEEAERVATAGPSVDRYAWAIAGARDRIVPPAPSRSGLPDLGPPVDIAIDDGDPTRGAAEAPLTLIAFMDFECPHSADAAAAIRRLEERHPGRLRIVFKHLPLAMHDDARNAAAAAMAAQRQGRFWEMHDWLFAHQDTLDRVALERAAGELGLDLARFRRDFDDPAVTDQAILAAEAEGRRLGFEGTPMLVVDGVVVPGLIDDELLDELVAGRLAAVGG